MQDLFLHNMRLLHEKNPPLHARVARADETGCAMPLATPSGGATLFWRQPEPGFFLHSPLDPLQEAEDLLEGYEFRAEDITVLLGCGLGYLPLAILKRKHPEHLLLVLEASPELLKAACRQVDLTPLLKSQQVHLFSTDQIPRIWEILEPEVIKIELGQVHKLIYPPARQIAPEAYKTAEEKIERIVASLQSASHFIEHHSDAVMENILRNLPILAQTAGVDSLERFTAGEPVLVVAAGPSLDTNIRLIKRAKGNFLIIAVDTALKPLLAQGIRPDLVVSIDPIPVNFRKFEQIPEAVRKNTPLVFGPDVYYKIPRFFSGPKFVFGDQNPLCRWLLGLAGRIPEFGYGFSVAHYAFYLARAMGGDPIIFAGLDLAFKGDQDHARNSASSFNMETMRPDLVSVPGNNEDTVLTHPRFLTMIALFEREIADTTAECINATQGGARIEGARSMPLDKVIRRWGGAKEGTNFRGRLKDRWASNLLESGPQVKNGLKWLLDEARSITDTCQAALPLFEPLMAAFESGNGNIPWEKIRELNRMTDAVSAHAEFREHINDWIRALALEKTRLVRRCREIPDEKGRLLAETGYARFFFEKMQMVSDAIIRLGRPVFHKLQEDQNLPHRFNKREQETG